MPYIKVDINQMRSYSSDLDSIKNKVSSIKRCFSSVSSALDWDVKASSNIRSRTNNITDNLDTEISSLSKMSNFVSNTLAKYRDLDESKIHANDIPLSLQAAVKAPIASANTTEFTDAETDAIIEELSLEIGVDGDEIQKGLRDGLFDINDIIDWLAKGTSVVNGFTKFLLGATKFTVDTSKGWVILSNFTRTGLLNKFIKLINNGTGLSSHYTVSNFLDKPIGKLYNFGQKVSNAAKVIKKVTNVVEAGVYAIDDVIDATGKIQNIWADESKSEKDKVCETTAVGITSAAATALDVAAPFVGTAVAGAVSAFATPIVGALAGAAVSGVMHFASDVIASDEVVGAVSNGVKAVCNAGQQLLESKNAGEAITNTVNLVGETVKAGINVVSTVLTKAVDNTVKAVTSFFKGW